MIINTEIKEDVNMFGESTKTLWVSYVDSDGKNQIMRYTIPPSLMYQWKYAKKSETPDPVMRSWDFKNVIKVPLVGNFTEQRIHEILMDLITACPEASVINELNVPDTSFFDIETNVDDNGVPDAKHANNTINTISLVHNKDVIVFGLAPLTISDVNWIKKEISTHCAKFTTKYEFEYRFYENEYNMLVDFLYNYFATSNCVTGWNIFGYDWPYIYNRCEKLGIDLSFLSKTGNWYKYKPQMANNGETINVPMHFCMYDYMEVYKKWDQTIKPKEQNSLDWVSEKVLGVKKVVHQLGFKDMWEQQKKEYVFYNAVDSILVREIDKSLKTSNVFFSLAGLMHTPCLTAFSSSRSIEIVQAEYLYRENRVFPVVGKQQTGDDSYEGAYVFEPVAGIKRNVLTLDFASLYPTTMRQFNISPDTFLGKDITHRRQDNEIMTISGAIYTKEFEGFIPKILSDYYGQRKKYKKQMNAADDDYYKLEEIYKRRIQSVNNG